MRRKTIIAVIIILLVLIVCAGVGGIIKVKINNKSEGETWVDYRQGLEFAPGALYDPERTKPADQSIVGKKVKVSFDSENAVYFAYFYNDDTKKECLFTVIEVSSECSPATVYETDFGGLDGLLQAVNSPFEARVLANLTIWSEELMLFNSFGSGGICSQDEIIDANTPAENSSENQYYYGAILPVGRTVAEEENWSQLSDSVRMYLVGNMGGKESEGFKSYYKEVFQERFERYGIDSIISDTVK